MANAQTGNPLIPGVNHPSIAQSNQPVQQYAQPVPAPSDVPVESYDFWSSLEHRIEPTEDYEGNQVSPAPAVQGQVPVTGPQAPYELPAQEAQLSPEQIQAIAQYQQPQPQYAPPAAVPQSNQQQMEAGAIAQLVQEYAIPQDVASQYVTEPEKMLPELAARLHIRIATALGQVISQVLPSIIAPIVDQKMQAIKLEHEFFQQYPQLVDQRFRNVVMHSISLARQASPNATREQVMSDGAMLAATKLRIQLHQQGRAPVAQPQAPAAQQRTNGYVPPYQPVMGGGAGLPTNQQAPQNEFEALAQDPNW